MDSAAPAEGRIGPTRRETARALGSAMIGNWFELFDFIIYGYFAAQIGHAMFPEADPVTIAVKLSPSNPLMRANVDFRKTCAMRPNNELSRCFRRAAPRSRATWKS